MVSLRKSHLTCVWVNGAFGKPCRRCSLESAANALILASEFSRFGIRRASFFAGMTIVRAPNVLMNINSLLTNGDIGRMRVNPASAIEIVDSVLVLVLVHGGVGVAAEN